MSYITENRVISRPNNVVTMVGMDEYKDMDKIIKKHNLNLSSMMREHMDVKLRELNDLELRKSERYERRSINIRVSDEQYKDILDTLGKHDHKISHFVRAVFLDLLTELQNEI